MNNFLRIVLTIGGIVGLIWTLYSAARHVATLESRIDKLENQVRVIATAPTVVRPGSSSPENSKTKQDGSDFPTDVAVPNPLIATCRDLILRAATAAEKGDIGAKLDLQGYIKDLSCAVLFERSQ